MFYVDNNHVGNVMSKLIVSSPYNFKNKQNMEKISKNFVIRKTLVGKGIKIVVESQGFSYDHDEVMGLAEASDNAKDRKHSVNRSSGYSKTKGFPKWAQPAVNV